MTIAAFFLNRRFPDQIFLQIFLRGLGRVSLLGLFVLVLSVLFLGLGGGTAAFAQAEQAEQAERAKKNYLGVGVGFIGTEGEKSFRADPDTGHDRDDEPYENRGIELSLSYMRPLEDGHFLWFAPNYTRADSVQRGTSRRHHSSLDMHLLLRTPISFFIGAGLSYVSYEEEVRGVNTVEISGTVPSLRYGFLFDGSFGALMLDIVSRREVSGAIEVPAEGEASIRSYRLAITYLFSF